MTILLPTDNPHELLDIKCCCCRERLIETREEIHNRGWMMEEQTETFQLNIFGARAVRTVTDYFCPSCFIEPEPT